MGIDFVLEKISEKALEHVNISDVQGKVLEYDPGYQYSLGLLVALVLVAIFYLFYSMWFFSVETYEERYAQRTFCLEFNF